MNLVKRGHSQSRKQALCPVRLPMPPADWTNFCSEDKNCPPLFQLLNHALINSVRFWACIALFLDPRWNLWFPGLEGKLSSFCLWKVQSSSAGKVGSLAVSSESLQETERSVRHVRSGCLGCSSAYHRHSCSRTHLRCSRESRGGKKGTCMFLPRVSSSCDTGQFSLDFP